MAETIEFPKQAFGFSLLRHEYIKEYASEALVYVHDKTGAELISIVNQDENKCFCVFFRTPVNDSCGTPHVLEHSVLAGSRKYPVKEPFIELIKSSLNTFINAFTFLDRTCYPVASCNVQDLYNLVDVYLDAVFFPSCLENPLVFAQEGWHYELENKDQPMICKGVVYNEMKGEFSSPDSLHVQNSTKHLFPNNPYQYISFGDPKAIPNLTYEQFKDFHNAYYHPSNARFWMYGNDDPLKRLEILSRYLENFDKKEIDSKIQLQPLMKEPRTVVESYAAGDNDKSFITLHWLLSEDCFDVKTELALKFLNYLLLGTPASPLYKKLSDSKLGEAVLKRGFSSHLRQATFGVGLKGVNAQDVEKVETVIMDELMRLASEGFPQDSIEAAMNTIEFSLRENNTGSYPRGLGLLMQVMRSWNYDKDPLESIKWQTPFDELKKQLQSGDDVFCDLIRSLFIKNKHRLKYELKPDIELGAKIAREEEQKLQDLKSRMSPEEIDQQIKLTEKLKLHQETPDSVEDLKTIPILKLTDIPKETPKIPTEVLQKHNATYLLHDLFTNEILYFILALDMRHLPSELLPLVPLFCESLTEMGTEKNDFVQLTKLIGRKTGGVKALPMISCKKDSEEPVAKILVSGKATKDKIADLLEIIKEILLDVKLDNKERFKQLVLKSKANKESSIIRSGNSFVMKRLAAQRTVADAVEELMSGLEYITYIRLLSERVENDWSGVLKELESCQNYLINAQDVTVSLTADHEIMVKAQPLVDQLIESLPRQNYPKQNWEVVFPVQNEAFTVPTMVNYVGKGVDLLRESKYTFSGSSEVVTKHIFGTWLWNKVRASGGAYGCNIILDSESGVLTFASYRDPNLMETIEVYNEVSKFLKESKMDEDALTRAIIGAIGKVDPYRLPDGKGRTAMMRYLLGITDEWRQTRREEILATKEEDFVKLGEHFEAIKSEKASVVAITSQERAEEITKQNPGYWKITKVL
eukprot:g627.t1